LGGQKFTLAKQNLAFVEVIVQLDFNFPVLLDALSLFINTLTQEPGIPFARTISSRRLSMCHQIGLSISAEEGAARYSKQHSQQCHSAVSGNVA
jgi:hypothetical protein